MHIPKHNRNIEQLIANIKLNGEKFEAIPLKSGTRQGSIFTPYLFKVVLKIQGTVIKKKKKDVKGIHIGKKEVKISLFADGMIVYIRDPKNHTREHVNLMNSSSKVSGYKIYSNKSVAFLYKNNKQTEKEIRVTAPFTKSQLI
jgi:hypothetical protein